MDTAELLGAVAREFETTGADTPPWPDPHAGFARPRDEEYSRCLDPGKYRIVAARAEAWAHALVATGLAERAPVIDLDAAWQDGAPYPDQVRGVWLRPYRAGTLPLLLVLRSVLTDDDALLIGTGEPAALLSRAPECGCDACDDGSAGLLEVIDEQVLDVVTGSLVHAVLRDGTTVIGGEDSWSASGSRRDRIADRTTIETAIARVRAGTWTGPALHGASWW